MKTFWTIALALCVLTPGVVSAQQFYHVKLDSIMVEVPDDWRIRQEFEYGNTRVIGLEKGDEYIMFYSDQGTSKDLRSVFVNGSQVEQSVSRVSSRGFSWDVIQTSKEATFESGKTRKYMTGFMSKVNGRTYYGYTRTNSSSSSQQLANKFIENVQLYLPGANRSLTAPDFQGKKFYLGWGVASGGDPAMMHNEVKYDVLHTHDIFANKVGGDYNGTKYTGSVSSRQIRADWKQMQENMLWNDMFVQYSSGHGSQSGLAVGVSYNEIRDNILRMPAKEIVVFTMACFSGGLVNSFNQKRSVWQNWNKWGRSLMVMSSSRHSETSSTGPGTDPGQQGPNGSAGSAFGHALWKALIGYADGDLDGIKDGFVSLGELEHYTRWKTRQVGRHTPQVTGSFNRHIVMNVVPSKAYLASLPKSTEGLSDDEVAKLVQELDRELSIE